MGHVYWAAALGIAAAVVSYALGRRIGFSASARLQAESAAFSRDLAFKFGQAIAAHFRTGRAEDLTFRIHPDKIVVSADADGGPTYELPGALAKNMQDLVRGINSPPGPRP